MDVWILAMLRGGTAALRIETGRWNGKREERICRQCTMGQREAVVDCTMELEC